MITVIGAGPVGCYAAYLLAKAGKDVLVFEEHKSIGSPVQCTGIVTSEINKIIGLNDSFIVNRLNSVRVFSENCSAEIPVEEIVLDREKFDRHFADMAEKAGAGIFLNSSFVGYSNGFVKILDRRGIRKIKTEVLIGADGANSVIARLINRKKREYYLGLQARARLRTDGLGYEAHFGITTDFFGWVVPESREIARIGVASRNNAKSYFNNFLINKKIRNSDILEKQGGLIPVFNPRYCLQSGSIYLAGDAALQVKATTGGGLVPGLKAARILADCILNNKDYSRELNKSIGRELKISLILRRILNKFNDKDYDYLIGLMNKRKIKDILRDYNRDNPSGLLFRLIATEPRLLFFITKTALFHRLKAVVH